MLENMYSLAWTFLPMQFLCLHATKGLTEKFKKSFKNLFQKFDKRFLSGLLCSKDMEITTMLRIDIKTKGAVIRAAKSLESALDYRTTK